ncbi:hypothetical protein NTE_00298 [Candidatus Nitrososphaera evergladensis SR1]|uniref:Uncharacterized protein n=1 Tax=Candidatus Nitrososphaera evergladensis SR1 TaxID=1459636 RepID=A0A075MML5_9ARCH|nr:hypothetical protein NTE_00298 [Candidatus Nitrososphaera evergladensis SR1]
MEFTFHRNRIDKIPRQRMLDELEKVARQFNYIEFGKRDFARYSAIHSTTVIKEFGSWSKNVLTHFENGCKKRTLTLHLELNRLTGYIH